MINLSLSTRMEWKTSETFQIDQRDEEETIVFEQGSTRLLCQSSSSSRWKYLARGDIDLVKRTIRDGKQMFFLRFWKDEGQTIELILLSNRILFFSSSSSKRFTFHCHNEVDGCSSLYSVEFSVTVFRSSQQESVVYRLVELWKRLSPSPSFQSIERQSVGSTTMTRTRPCHSIKGKEQQQKTDERRHQNRNQCRRSFSFLFSSQRQPEARIETETDI